MIVEVMRWQIVFDFVGFPSWTEHRFVVVRVDDSDYSISVRIHDGSDNPAASPVSGPSSLYQGMNGMASRVTTEPFYQYCDGTTLRKIGEINSFPYAAWNDFPNNSQCQIAPVCDLEISSIYSVVDATGPEDANGQIQVSATSSNGTIKYGLDSAFNYAGSTNTTGLFTGLVIGTYTVYAKDAIGCTDSIDITIAITTVYNVKYRGEYDTINGAPSKVEILERGYVGAVSEVCFGGTPFKLDYDESGKFSKYIACHSVCELLEETEGEFEDLFTNDDRKYRMNYYRFLDSDWQLITSHYVIPEFYQKPFVQSENNYVTVKASDQMGQMKAEPFLDENENKFRGFLSQIEIICRILRKTDLHLNIRVQDNIFEQDMVTTDSPLAQAFVDVRIFYKEDGTALMCDEVLNYVIGCKSGLRLFMSRGYWWLVRSEYNAGTFDYFEYDIDATLVDSDTYSAPKNRVVPQTSSGLMWANASQIELYESNYGKFELTHILGFDDNLIDEGRFEEEDIIDISNGNKTFKNWSVNVIQPGIKYGLEYVDNGLSKGAFFMDFDSAGGTQSDNVIYSTEIPLDAVVYPQQNLVKFKFQYKALPYYKFPWITLRYQVRFTSATDSNDHVYLVDNGLPSGFTKWLPDETFNDVYVNNYNSFQTYEITVPMGWSSGLAGTIRIAFYLHDHRGRDYGSLDDLRAVFTDDPLLDVGKRVIIFDTDTDFTLFYELEYGQEAESTVDLSNPVPDVVRPNDWELFTNPKVWRLKGKFFSSAATTGLVSKWLIDNVQFTYIPFLSGSAFNEPRNYQPPATAEYDRLVNKFNKVKYEETFLLGDLPEMENGKNLYRGYLRYEDGTPTSLWYRNGVTESKKLLLIALDERVEQLKTVQRKIQADLLQKNTYYAFVDSLSYDSRRFINGRYLLDDKNNIISLDLLQMTTGAGGEPPVEAGAFSEAYSDDFDNI